MAAEKQVPIFADGGYWLCQPASPSIEYSPGWEVAGAGSFAAVYAEIDGTMYAAYRVPDAITNQAVTDAKPADVFAAAGLGKAPFMRIGGR